MQKKRIHIITGHYGSGKSEISVNYAIQLKKRSGKIVFADLDIINPYFRSNEARNILDREGITVITTKYANTNVDIPALTGEVSRYLHDHDASIVMDVGGDDAGAKVVGRYKSEFPESETCLYFVVNCFRPETKTVEGVIEILQEIRGASKMKVDYIINNSHLMEETGEKDIFYGYDFVRQVSIKTGIPIAFHAVLKGNMVKKPFTFKEPVFLMDKYMGMRI